MKPNPELLNSSWAGLERQKLLIVVTFGPDHRIELLLVQVTGTKKLRALSGVFVHNRAVVILYSLLFFVQFL